MEDIAHPADRIRNCPRLEHGTRLANSHSAPLTLLKSLSAALQEMLTGPIHWQRGASKV